MKRTSFEVRIIKVVVFYWRFQESRNTTAQPQYLYTKADDAQPAAKLY